MEIDTQYKMSILMSDFISELTEVMSKVEHDERRNEFNKLFDRDMILEYFRVNRGLFVSNHIAYEFIDNFIVKYRSTTYNSISERMDEYNWH